MTKPPRTLEERLAQSIIVAWMRDERWLGVHGNLPAFWAEIAAVAALDTQSKLLAEASEALEPFALAAVKYGETWADQMTARESGIKVRDCRKARTVLAKLKAATPPAEGDEM